jgi:hypothetical protein
MRVHHLNQVGLLTILLAVGVVGTARAQCPEPNGNDQESDYVAIQCLLDQGGTIVLNADVQFGYYLDRGLRLWQSGTSLTGSSAFGYRALLWAMPSIDSQPSPADSVLFRVEPWVTDYTISNIAFNGNRFSRPNARCAAHQVPDNF